MRARLKLYQTYGTMRVEVMSDEVLKRERNLQVALPSHMLGHILALESAENLSGLSTE